MTIITSKINYVIKRGDNISLFDVNHHNYCNIVLIIYICDVLHQVLRIYMLICNIIPFKCVALYYNY